MNPTVKQWIISYPARLVVYGLITMLTFFGVYELLQLYGADWLAAENGPIELAQVGCLLIAVACITMAARWTPFGRAVMVATGAATLYAAARESDLWFETTFFDDAYKWLVGLPAVLLIMVFIYRERDKLVSETIRISRYPGATMFVMAGIYLCFFCQMFDRPLFWAGLGEGGASIAQKNLVEETSELYAYLLIVFASIEAVISAAQDRAELLRVQSEESGAALIVTQQLGPVERMAA